MAKNALMAELPSFKNPPVIETVLGLRFSPIPDWNVGHFGLFWHGIRHEFPKLEIKPPLQTQIEKFEPTTPERPGSAKGSVATLKIGPAFRC